MTTILDLFAGHGVGVACRNLGVGEHAVEKWDDAVETRRLNGLDVAYRDVWDIERANDLEFDGLWASPPCQTFSTAGSGSGRAALDKILAALSNQAYEDVDSLRDIDPEDDRTGLVLSPMAYVHRFHPRFVILEQVTPVLPIWEAMAVELRARGYSAWTGVLDAVDYGVPQTRRRAYLIARRDGVRAVPPQQAQVTTTLRGIRPDQEGVISNYSSGSGGIIIPGNKKPRGYRTIDQPAFTVTGKVRANRWFPSMERVTQREALMMQSYPEDFQLYGDWSLQVGNAVPPRLAEAVLRTVM